MVCPEEGPVVVGGDVTTLVDDVQKAGVQDLEKWEIKVVIGVLCTKYLLFFFNITSLSHRRGRSSLIQSYSAGSPQERDLQHEF